MRIGILGGTFNPVHLGHLILAQEAAQQLSLDRVIFIPAYLPPHKGVRAKITPQERHRMVVLATRNNPRFTVSQLEIDRQGTSYTIDTLIQLRKILGQEAKLFFLAGSDSLPELSSWKEPDQLLKLVRFIVVNRPNYPVRKLPQRVKLLPMALIDISSSEIRRKVRNGLSIRYLVPETVRRYIKRKRLYCK